MYRVFKVDYHEYIVCCPAAPAFWLTSNPQASWLMQVCVVYDVFTFELLFDWFHSSS